MQTLDDDGDVGVGEVVRVDDERAGRRFLGERDGWFAVEERTLDVGGDVCMLVEPDRGHEPTSNGLS